jgi:hypothetical protein
VAMVCGEFGTVTEEPVAASCTLKMGDNRFFEGVAKILLIM